MYSRVLCKASSHLFSMETVEYPFVFFFATPDFEVVGEFELTFFFFFFFVVFAFADSSPAQLAISAVLSFF